MQGQHLHLSHAKKCYERWQEDLNIMCSIQSQNLSESHYDSDNQSVEIGGHQAMVKHGPGC